MENFSKSPAPKRIFFGKTHFPGGKKTQKKNAKKEKFSTIKKKTQKKATCVFFCPTPFMWTCRKTSNFVMCSKKITLANVDAKALCIHQPLHTPPKKVKK